MMHGVTEKPGKWLAPEPSGVVADVTEPNFSVLIPAYQAARTIGEAVESALTQTVQPQEIIVCDDGSTDDLSGALEPYRDRITVVRLEQNQGLSAARNAALMAASSEFVATLDADDTYLPRYLEAIAGSPPLAPTSRSWSPTRMSSSTASGSDVRTTRAGPLRSPTSASAFSSATSYRAERLSAAQRCSTWGAGTSPCVMRRIGTCGSG